MHQTNTFSCSVLGTRDATRVAVELTQESIWFQMTPQPFDLYEFTVNASDAGKLTDHKASQPPHRMLLIDRDAALVLLRKAIATYVETESPGATYVHESVVTALLQVMDWHDTVFSLAVAAFDPLTAYFVVFGDDAGHMESIGFAVAEGRDGRYFTSMLGGPDGVTGIQYEDQGPYPSASAALFSALGEAVQYATENDYIRLEFNQRLAATEARPADEDWYRDVTETARAVWWLNGHEPRSDRR